MKTNYIKIAVIQETNLNAALKDPSGYQIKATNNVAKAEVWHWSLMKT